MVISSLLSCSLALLLSCSLARSRLIPYPLPVARHDRPPRPVGLGHVRDGRALQLLPPLELLLGALLLLQLVLAVAVEAIVHVPVDVGAQAKLAPIRVRFIPVHRVFDIIRRTALIIVHDEHLVVIRAGVEGEGELLVISEHAEEVLPQFFARAVDGISGGDDDVYVAPYVRRDVQTVLQREDEPDPPMATVEKELTHDLRLEHALVEATIVEEQQHVRSVPPPPGAPLGVHQLLEHVFAVLVVDERARDERAERLARLLRRRHSDDEVDALPLRELPGEIAQNRRFSRAAAADEQDGRGRLDGLRVPLANF